MVWTLKRRGLVLLAAAPLLGGAPAGAATHADGPVPAAYGEAAYGEAAASKPPPRPRTHTKPKKHGPTKHKPKKHTKHKAKQHKAKHEVRADGVVLRTRSPERAVIPGRTYAWAFTVTAKGPGKSGKAVFRTTLPKSLAFVSGTRHCKAAGRKVVCHLGTVRKGRKATGVIRAKVSRHAEPGQKISPRGTATWGKAHATRGFPAVRVAKTAGPAMAKAAPATARAVHTKITERRRPDGATRGGLVRGWDHASSDLH